MAGGNPIYGRRGITRYQIVQRIYQLEGELHDAHEALRDARMALADDDADLAADWVEDAKKITRRRWKV